MLDVSVIGTPATASSTVIPTINVNGNAVESAPITAGATPEMTEFNVRTVLSLNRGDIMTITNTGASAATIDSASTYNVNILIERFN